MVRKAKEMYYGILSDFWPRNKRIEIRGLDKDTMYEAYDYGNRKSLGEVKYSSPQLPVGFKESLLLRVRRGPARGRGDRQCAATQRESWF